MASAAAPAAANSTLPPPLEQLRHLAGELRFLLPGVRGELTYWGRATAGAGLGGKGRGRGGRGVRAEEVGSGGGSAYLCSFFCGRPARTPRPLVGEARETTKEFDRETFWRRLRECLSCCRLPSLISCSVPTPFLPAFPRPILSVGIPRLTHPRHL